MALDISAEDREFLENLSRRFTPDMRSSFMATIENSGVEGLSQKIPNYPVDVTWGQYFESEPSVDKRLRSILSGEMVSGEEEKKTVEGLVPTRSVEEAINELVDRVSKTKPDRFSGRIGDVNITSPYKSLAKDLFSAYVGHGDPSRIIAMLGQTDVKSAMKQLGLDTYSPELESIVKNEKNFSQNAMGYILDKIQGILKEDPSATDSKTVQSYINSLEDLAPKYGIDFSGQINTLKTKLDVTKQLEDGKIKKEQAEIKMSNLLKTLPQELQESREQYIKGETETAKKTLEEQLTPEILAGLNVRGLLTSGDLESALASATAGVYRPVQQREFELQAQDDKFFQDVAYQNELRKAIESGQDITAELGAKREKTITEQQERFGASQAELNRNLAQQLFNKQQARLLTAQTLEAKRRAEAEERAGSAGMLGQVGQVAGTVGGALVGGAIGGLPGAAIGAGLGGGVGGLTTTLARG